MQYSDDPYCFTPSACVCLGAYNKDSTRHLLFLSYIQIITFLLILYNLLAKGDVAKHIRSANGVCM